MRVNPYPRGRRQDPEWSSRAAMLTGQPSADDRSEYAHTLGSTPMAALRQSYDPDPSPGHRLEVVGSAAYPESLEGNPARGVAIGLIISVAGFWLPAVGLVLLLLRLR